VIEVNELHEEIEGDLIQKFNRDVKIFGERKAKKKIDVECSAVFQTIDFAKQ
jgi:hypothetical protein